MIVGIFGKARSGKDQFGEYLLECLWKRHSRLFTHMAFATQLKTMCMNHFGLSTEQLWGDEKESTDERFDKHQPIRPFCGGLGKDKLPSPYWTAREIMQELGSFYRKIKSDYWVYALDHEAKKQGCTNIIITDTRHINECAYIKKNKGLLLKITRSEVGQIHGMDHESETALDDYADFDIEIKNDGTLEDLYKAAEANSDAIITLERLMKRGEVYNGKE